MDRDRRDADHRAHVSYSIHRHYMSIMAQLRRGTVTPGDFGTNHVVLLVRDLGASTAEALGYIRSFRPQDVHAVFPTRSDTVPVGDPGPLASVRWRGSRPGAAPLAAEATSCARCGPTSARCRAIRTIS